MVHVFFVCFAACTWLQAHVNLWALAKTVFVFLSLTSCGWWLTPLSMRAWATIIVACTLAVGRASCATHRWRPLQQEEQSTYVLARMDDFTRRPCVDGACSLLQTAHIFASSDRASGPFRARHERVRLFWSRDLSLARGDVVLLRATLRPLDVPRAPWQPSRAQQCQERGVTATCELVAGPLRIASGAGVLPRIDRTRLRLARAFDAVLPPESAAIAKALALGDASSIDSPQRDAFADAGIAHLLAVSGMHIAIVAQSVSWGLCRLLVCCRGCVAPGRWAALLTLVPVWGYAALTGTGVAVFRAALMASVVLGARAVGLSGSHGKKSLSFAGIVVLWREPGAIEHASALLSFACVAALMTLMPRASIRARASALSRAMTRLGLALCQSLIATAASWPIVAAFFGRMAWVAPVTNLLAIPLATLVATPLSLVTALWLALCPDGLLARTLALWLHGSLCALSAVARASGASVWAASPSPPWSSAAILSWLVLWLMMAAGLWQWRESTWLRLSRSTMGCAALAALLTCVCACWLPGWRESTFAPQRGSLCVWQLDVGQGEATLVHMPNGQWMLIDGGGTLGPRARDPGRDVVVPALRALGVTRLALVVLTHPHPDHLLGLAAVMRRTAIDRFVYNADAQTHPLVRSWSRLLRARGATVGLPERTYGFGEASVEISQASLARRTGGSGENDRSLVTSIRFRDSSVLLTGDIEQRAEVAMLPLGHHDIVQVPHHGSQTSSHDAFVQAVSAHVALISCGRRNRFGHPVAEVCQRWRDSGARVLSTAQAGTLRVCSNGRQWTMSCGASGDCGDDASIPSPASGRGTRRKEEASPPVMIR